MNRGTGRILSRERAGILLNILLFGINVIGITGALLETSLVDWRSEFNQSLLWGGLAAFCVVSVLWWLGKKKAVRWTVRRTIVLLCTYAAVAFLYRETIANSLAWIFRNMLEMCNEYYGSEETMQYAAELLQKLAVNGVGTAEVRTLCFLAVLLPVCLLTGLLFSRGKWQVFLAEDILLFMVSCITDVFPGLTFLSLCVMGIILAAVGGEFRDSAAAWAQAAAGIIALTFLGIIFVERLALPVINEQYERSGELRYGVYAAVNYKWIPWLQHFFNGNGFGAGVDVTGAIGRQSRASHTTLDVYRVTLDAMPRRTLYLRGFVGVGYNRRKWDPEDERALEQYYLENDFTLYEDGRELLNVSFEAAQDNARTNTIKIDELLGQGRYSLLPYGAMVTEEFPVHSGGTVDRIDGSYSLHYRDISVVDEGSFTEQWREIEEQYRQYAYASFLDYPEERLPQLTQALEEAELPKGDVYRCAGTIIDFLEENGTYRLDVAATPVGKDFVEHFLFESHEGFCAHFASAAVLMFRYCGIPARYATGYSVSAADFSRTPENLYAANLTGSQAHAWAEVYVDGVGWVPVETTPGAAAFAGDNRQEMLRRLGILTGDIEPVRGEAFIDEDEDEEDEETEESGSLSLLPDEKEELEDGVDDETGIQIMSGLTGLIYKILLTALPTGAVFVILFGSIRCLRWNRKLEKAGGREKIFLLYHNMRNALQVMGCPKELVLTGEAFWERLQKVLPSQSREEYDAVCTILEQSSFGNRAPSGEELEMLETLHDEMLARLYLIAPFYKKPAFAGVVCVLPSPSAHTR